MDKDRIKWNERYRSEEWFLGRSPSRYLVEQIDFIKQICPGRNALDVACGEGRNSIFLARNGFRVTGLDIADAGIAKARKWMESERLDITFEEVDLDDFISLCTYDLIINFNFLQRDMIPRLVAALTRGGVLVFDTILDTPALTGSHDNSFLLQPGELPKLFTPFSGSIYAYHELPEEVSPTAKLIFQASIS